jgi:hypothetical protein
LNRPVRVLGGLEGLLQLFGRIFPVSLLGGRATYANAADPAWCQEQDEQTLNEEWRRVVAS